MTKAEIAQLCRNLLATSDEYDQQAYRLKAMTDGGKSLVPWLEEGGSWGRFYTTPFDEFLLKFMVLMNLTPDSLMPSLEGFSQQPFDIEDLRTHYTRAPDDLPDDQVSVREALLPLLVQVNQGHLLALDLFNHSMDEFLNQLTEGDDQGLFRAITVDPAVLAAYPAQVRLATATLAGDHAFFDGLVNALQKTKPQRPHAEYDRVRYLVGTIDASGYGDAIPLTELCDMFINDLKIYPHDGKDPFAALGKLIKNFRRLRRT